MKIHDLISQAIEHRVGYGQFPKIYAELRKNGIDDIMRDRLITVLIAWVEKHEKDCNLLNEQVYAKVNKEPSAQPINDSRNVDNTSSSSSTGDSK